MKQLDNFITKVGVDKLLHFLVAYAMAATGLMHSFLVGGIMMGVVLVLSVIKELWLDDRADWMDVCAAVIGCACAGVVGVASYFML